MCGYNDGINDLVNKVFKMQTDLAYFTECQLATLEGMRCTKSTSKSALSRQQGIVDKMVTSCYTHGVDKLERRNGPGLSTGRLWDIFDTRT